MAKKVLTGFTTDVNNVQALADQPTQSAATLKQIFDTAGNEVKTDGNGLVAELQDSTLNDSGGHAIGLGIAGVTADNVAEGIKEVYDAIAGIALGAIPDNSITAAKMAEDMDKGVAGGVEAFNDALTHKQNHINHIHYAAASGSANVYAVTLDASVVALTEGFAVAFKPSATNSGASTLNVNGIGAVSIKTPSGANVAAGQLVIGNIYTLRYNGTNFILQGEGAIGNMVAADLLSGKTGTTPAGLITGSMVDRGTVNIMPSTANQTILGGKHSGSGVVYGDANLVASKIVYPNTLFGVTGTAKIRGATLTEVASAASISTNISRLSVAGEQIADFYTFPANCVGFSFVDQEWEEETMSTLIDTYVRQVATTSSSSMAEAQLYLEDASGNKVYIETAKTWATQMAEDDKYELIMFSVYQYNGGVILTKLLRDSFDSELVFSCDKVTGAFDMANNVKLKGRVWNLSAGSAYVAVYGKITTFAG